MSDPTSQKNKKQRRTGEATLLRDVPCPRCGNYTLLCYLLTNEAGQHMHTRYVCTFYGSGRRSNCDWNGWTVPESLAGGGLGV